MDFAPDYSKAEDAPKTKIENNHIYTKYIAITGNIFLEFFSVVKKRYTDHKSV